ncbi:MAG TPA: Hsp20/alpha crystallin family protein [Chloroflexota bacterium]|jgi:HSP20 family protein
MSVSLSMALWERVSGRRAWQPTADVYETVGRVSLTIELPGVSPDEVQVRLADNAVVIEGNRRMPELDAGGIFHTAEIQRGPFRLEVTLPARVRAETVSVRGELGLVFISLTKVDASHGH